MKRVLCAAAGLALLGGLAMAADPTIKDIMTKAHKGGNSLLQTMNKELKEDEPDWNDVQKDSKELVELGAALGKNKPPRGEPDSWEKLTKGYLDTAKSLEASAEKKDKSGAKASLGKLLGSCKGCHQVHRSQ
jgi:cytochrome c556